MFAPTGIKGFIAKVKRYYRYFLIALAAATTLIVALYLFAPRPEGGYVSSHPLSIATTYVVAGGCWVFVISVVQLAVKVVIRCIREAKRGEALHLPED